MTMLTGAPSGDQVERFHRRGRRAHRVPVPLPRKRTGVALRDGAVLSLVEPCGREGGMHVDAERRDALLRTLRRSAGPVPAKDLADQLHVSTRSVRHYVRTVNEQAGQELVRASHHGYELNLTAYQRFRARRPRRARRYDTPQQRLYLLCRRLVVQQDGTPVGPLAEDLAVSFDTLESDLGRARQLLRTYGLTLRREHNVLSVLGSERDKRRLVRQVLLDSASGLTPAMLQAFAADYPHFDLRSLREKVRQTLTAAGLGVNEYMLADVLVHLTIAADRVREGHTLDGLDGPDNADPSVVDLVDELADVVAGTLNIDLPTQERRFLRAVVAARGRPGPAGAEPDVSEEVTALVREAMGAVSAYYLLELGGSANVASLALHVQTLISRARAGTHLRNPLGTAFKTTHPLIHELALLFASTVETRTHITVTEGEVDFLAFHLGSLFQHQLEHGPLLTITAVVPQYHDVHRDLVTRLTAAVSGAALVEAVVTELDHDWAHLTSDLVVSVVDLPPDTSAPVVQISPFLSSADVDAIRAVLSAERRRGTSQKLRAHVLTLIEPALYHHIGAVSTPEAALELMCRAMVRADAADDGFLDDVLDRERRSSTAFGEQFAVPHSLYMDAPRTAISVLVSDEPIPWGDAHVRLVILFAVAPEQRPLFRDVLDQLIAVLGQPACVNALLAKGTDHAGFVRALDEMLDA